MKIRSITSLTVALLLLCSGCATYIPTGAIYTGAKAGVTAGSGDMTYSKIGTAENISVLGLVAVGDGSIQTAAKNGGITKIKFVDYEVENILGIYGRYKTIVYGD